MDVLPETSEVRYSLGLGLVYSLARLQSFPETNGDTLVVFLKRFDAPKQSLYGVGKMYVQRGMKVADLTGLINERLCLPPNTPLKLFEEVKPGMIELMKVEATFAQSEIQNGDIICFQVEIPEPE
jgi:ubiquitin carboxyl-terminal hydrolase 7